MDAMEYRAGGRPLGDPEELELASELLEVSGEEELEQFLGQLLRDQARRAGGTLGSSTGRALGGILKNVAAAVLAPGAATAMPGAGLGELAGEDEELERARTFLRVAATSARHAARAPRGTRPLLVARRSVYRAARRHAPGLARRFRRFRRPAPWRWPRPVRRVYYGVPVTVAEPPPTDQEPPGGAEEPEPAAALAAPPDDAGTDTSEPAAGQGAPEGAGPGEEPELEAWRYRRPHSGTWTRRGNKLVLRGM